MSWLSQNKFLAGFGAVMAAGIGTLGYLTYSASEDYDKAKGEYESAVGELHRLEELNPFPSDEHLKKFLAQKDELKAKIDGLQKSLAATQIKAEDITPTAFQDKLKEAVARVTAKAAEAKVAIPKDKFYLGFAEYQSEPPKPSAAPLLYRELRSIELLMDILIETKEVALNDLVRSPLKDEKEGKTTPKSEPKPTGNASRKGGDDESKKKLVHKDGIVLKFVTTQDRFNKILNQIVSNKEQFFIPRNVTILNEKQEPPAKTPVAAVAPAAVQPDGTPSQPDAAPADLKASQLEYVFGTERVDVTLDLDLVDFSEPDAPAPLKGGKKQEKQDK